MLFRSAYHHAAPGPPSSPRIAVRRKRPFLTKQKAFILLFATLVGVLIGYFALFVSWRDAWDEAHRLPGAAGARQVMPAVIIE